ncbi:MAG TPA: 3'(2'),5'-bisphosphate nucleotidase CysQ [Acidimicrobiales bacterium]|nr:3'(2'),5'-bisphosphate nucleotidase CysQ [Acidimicrobiales bacterium]
MTSEVAAVTADDHLLAGRLAEGAGRLLVALRDDMVAEGAPRWAIEDEGDRQAHRWIADELAAARRDDALLSEEGADGPARLRSSRVWIVDPLDGTREYGEHPRVDWAVHVALAVDGIPLVGAVSLPAQGLVFSTDSAGALPPPTDGGPTFVVSRSRPPAVARAVAEQLGGRLLPMGSAGAKAMAVVRGLADVYLHAGGQYEWDSCAPAAVAAAAGLHTSRVDGSPLRYNRADPWLPDLLICRPELAAPVLDAVGAWGGMRWS